VELALDHPELSSRELAVKFTDERDYYVSESSVYRVLKSRDLITAPAYVVIKVQGQNRASQSALADRFYILEGHWLGLVLSIHHSG